MRSTLRSSLSLLHMVVQHIYDTMQTLDQQLQMSFHGKFPINLLHLQNLTDTITNINAQLPDDKQLAFSTEDLRSTYKTPVLIFESEGHVFVTLHFPVMRSAVDVFDIYSIINFPFFLNNNTIARFKLDPGTKGLAVNTRKNTYSL